MPSLKADFNELMEKIRHGRGLGSGGSEPIYYLIFPPRQILEVKRELPAWTARLRNDGWDVHTFSIADAIKSIFNDTPLRKVWLQADRQAPMDWDRTNSSLANVLEKGALQRRLEQALEGLDGKKDAILLVTDLEALHPYMRIGSIEGHLWGKFCVPTVFLYPGTRTGKTRLKFLGFYREDGNYRSTHIGG